MPVPLDDLVEQLDSFDPEERRVALARLDESARAGEIEPAESTGAVNLHCHTFFSYNAYGYSPSRFAWEAVRQGLDVAGVVDFDCLDATCEFLSAGRLLDLKSVAGFETRVFVKEYGDRVINSPKEPGVFYLVGTGFVQSPPRGSDAARLLGEMMAGARARNLAMIEKVNAHLDPVRIDYERDVLPLTAAGNATERHMLAAYDSKARAVFTDRAGLFGFWASVLDENEAVLEPLIDDSAALRDLIRAKLMKFGGVGYAQPTAGTFPALDDVVAMTLECGAMPSACWLDGTSDGESDPVAHLGFMKSKGIPTLTIIPDRNWNVPDDVRESKVHNLKEVMTAAKALEMPIFVGTEMNKAGNRFVDDFSADAMQPHVEEFRRGANIAWGHTLLQMTAGVGYVGAWADSEFGDRADQRNDFFARVGASPYPAAAQRGRLAAIGPEGSAADYLGALGV